MDPIVTITETGCHAVLDCGCEIDGIAGKDGTLWWVPLVACPVHCGCVVCQRVRGYMGVLDKFDK